MSETIELQTVTLPKKRTKAKSKPADGEGVETPADKPEKPRYVRHAEYYVNGKFSSKLYNEINREQAREKASVMVKCSCTCWVRKDRMSKHIRTNKHIKILALTEPERNTPHIG